VCATGPPNRELPNAGEGERTARLSGTRVAVCLDYDGTLTPIVSQPEDAVISLVAREAVRRLAGRCPVCVVGGRDRRVVQRLMGVDDLVVASSHGFDMWSPVGGQLERAERKVFSRLLERMTETLRGSGPDLSAERWSRRRRAPWRSTKGWSTRVSVRGSRRWSTRSLRVSLRR